MRADTPYRAERSNCVQRSMHIPSHRYAFTQQFRRDAMASTRRARSAPKSAKSSASKTDAIALLKADHREVEGWFSQFEKTKSEAKQAELARKICSALKVH